jgi:two-component sensor histidine kinase
MALVHEKLYESKDCAKINFAEYIETLISYLFQVYAGRSENIALELDIDELFLNIDTAIPCGLIISELVSNALKYAFPNNNAGVIHVELYPEIDNYLTLLVKDNGIGLPINFDIKSVKSLGLQLVNVLTTQLEGTLEINHCVGTEFQIKFSQSSC